MALNFVRGFRRIGWALTVPLSALVVLALWQQTKKVVGYDHDAIADYVGPGSWRIVAIDGVPVEEIVKREPEKKDGLMRDDWQEKRIKEIEALLLTEKLSGKPAKGLANLNRYKVEIRRVNKLKLAGLVAGSVVIPALVIQGFISVLAWILRGFKG
jgi:hypothetical protein